jgi:UDP-3-O-[3-hydroxymyristoyl] glucosamine N-acyltransferase
MVSEETRIGDNCFVFEANVIQPFVTIGNDVVLWSGNHIGHDVTIEDHVFIASHVVVSGNATIGARSFVGVNATFRDGVTVAPDCVIGAGASIMKDTVRGGVYAGPRTEPRERRSWELDF